MCCFDTFKNGINIMYSDTRSFTISNIRKQTPWHNPCNTQSGYSSLEDLTPMALYLLKIYIAKQHIQ